MKRKKFELIMDMFTCLLLIVGSWYCLWRSFYNFYYEYLEYAAFEFLAAIHGIIVSVIYILNIVPGDIEQIKEKSTIEKLEKYCSTGSGKNESEALYEIFEWLLDNQYDEADNSDDLLKNKVFGVWGDELAKKAEEYGVDIIDLRPTEETMKYRSKENGKSN